MAEQKRYKYFEPTRASRLGKLSLLARQSVEGFITGLHKSPNKGISAEFAEHREYVPGDDTRHLDWNVWGRSDRYFIKQYEQQTNLRACIALDCSASMAYRGGDRVSKYEYGCFLAGVLAYLMTHQQDAISLARLGADLLDLSPAASTPAHVDRILRELERTTPQGQGSLPTALHTLADRMPKRGLAVIISDFYSPLEEIVNALQHLLHNRHQVIVFHVLDPAEISLPFDGQVSVVDMETNGRVEIDAAAVRDEYNRQVAEFLAGLTRECHQRRIEYVRAVTDTPYDKLLLKYLAARRGVK